MLLGVTFYIQKKDWIVALKDLHINNTEVLKLMNLIYISEMVTLFHYKIVPM